MEIKNCKYCDNPFEGKVSNKVYCNTECRSAFYAEKYQKNKKVKEASKIIVKTECKQCDNLFSITNGVANQIFCSVECSKEWWRKDYYEKKKTTYFDIFEYDNFTCQYCGKTPQDGVKLVVDHIYPLSKGGSNKRHNLITSCKRCNRKKASRILSPKQIARFWSNNPKEFTYEEIEKFWEEYGNRRFKNLAKKPKG